MNPNEEIENWESPIDFQAMLAAKKRSLQPKQQIQETQVVKKEVITDSQISSVPNSEMQELLDFCSKHNIRNFKLGRLSPAMALQWLKKHVLNEQPQENKKTLLFG